MPLKTFSAQNDQRLYQNILSIDWTDYIDINQTFAIDHTVRSIYFKHSGYAALKTKDAIADHFRNKLGKRPSVDTEQPDIIINLHINNEECTISLDCSGAPLYKRGYRSATGPAPLNEVLAAGLIDLTGWDGVSPFSDPMCGSGTFLSEAILKATKTPAQFYRQGFGFQKWKNYDIPLWSKIKSEANQRRITTTPIITGYDIDANMIKIARQNILNMNTSFEYITLETRSLQHTLDPFPKGTIIMNPPYDERMTVHNIEKLYSNIGDVLKLHALGSRAWILSSNMQGFKYVGLRPSNKFNVFNGPLECKFQGYDMYEGSKRNRE